MGLHAAARLHAFVYGLFRPSEKEKTRQLYNQVVALFDDEGLRASADKLKLVNELASDILSTFGVGEDHPQFTPLCLLLERVFDYEGLFTIPELDWTQARSVTQHWEVRDQLNAQHRFCGKDFSKTKNLLRLAFTQYLKPIYAECPALLGGSGHTQDITVETELIRNIGDFGAVTDHILRTVLAEELQEAGLLQRLATRLERNLVAASGGNPADPSGFNRALKFPTKSDIADPSELVATYLGDTPLGDFFDQPVLFTIPTSSRFEHHHIVAGTGHGKTQTLQYLICKDLEAVAQGNRTVIVLDSQGDLIRNLANLAEFAPDGPLHERIVIIDPTDVEWPVSLNLFDVGVERLKGYEPLERERLTNSILELYDFVLGSLLSAEMTQKQSVIFRYVTRLMLHIPDATIHTFRELMEPGSEETFAPHIAKLTGTARHFFKTEFTSKEFEQTRKQVLRRLWGILENQTFERMFSHPRSKLDLFFEMNQGKLILINTAKDLLKEQGTEIFGRFFIALIAQAAQERAVLPPRQRLPSIVYIDEAADYFDRNIGIILSQARKYNVGMVLAHQYLGQLDPRLQDAFAANTAIKFAGGVSTKDARTLAPMLHANPGLIENLPKGSFAAHIRGLTKTAVPLTFPFGYLEEKPRMREEERRALQESMRARYAVHHTKLNTMAATPGGHLAQQEAEQEAEGSTKTNRVTPTRDIDTDAGTAW